jgi:cell pole-organizing protein PopZ
MGNPSAAHEPSMEEILASIRQIISEDSDTSTGAHAGGAAESRNGMANGAKAPLSFGGPPEASAEIPEHRASIAAFNGAPMKSTSASNGALASASAEPARKESAVSSRSRSVSIQPPAPPAAEGRLLSDGADSAVSGAFSALAHTILAQNARTLEDLVSEMLRPMLREWLDDNLPTLVERIVQDEIQRVSRGRR